MINLGTNPLWPSVLYYDTVKDKTVLDNVCTELLTSMSEAIDRTPLDHPITFNCGNILDLDLDIVHTFKEQIIVPAFERYMQLVYNKSLCNFEVSYKSWLVKYRDGRHMPTHSHPDSQVSAVFYLMADETDKGGAIEFTDGCTLDTITHQPNTGDIVIFPSYLKHNITPYHGKMRIAMPVDLFLSRRD
jgi:hypothetical protein